MSLDDPESTLQLLERARAGDHQALNALFARYVPERVPSRRVRIHLIAAKLHTRAGNRAPRVIQNSSLNHGAARGDRYAAYGSDKQYDFSVRHPLGVNPPPWNNVSATSSTQSAR